VISLLALMFAAPAQALDLESTDIQADIQIDNKHVLNGFGCSGENLSPALSWKNAPEGTKSFAVLVHDPDAPTGGAGWWHWLLIDIPASTHQLPTGMKTPPEGAREIKTDFGAPGWGGPCAPEGHGPHDYNFTVYALGVEKLELPEGATASFTGFIANANAIEKATIKAVFER
jgi:hypothetical protein